MLIAFDQYINSEESRIIYINPDFVVSVAPHVTEVSNFFKSDEKPMTEIDTVGIDDGTTHTWLVLGEPQHVAGLIRNGMTIRK